MRATDLPRTIVHQVRDACYIVVGLGVIGTRNAWAWGEQITGRAA